MQIERVISGGQSGVDLAGLRAARSLSIPTGGTAPRLWMTEDGPAPWLADFGLVECQEPQTEPPADRFGPEWRRWLATVWPPRTRANVAAADGTIWMGQIATPGYACTHDAALEIAVSYPWLVVYSGTRPSVVADWIRAKGIRTLNCAGSRESRSPGIGVRAERFLTAVFRRLAGHPGETTR